MEPRVRYVKTADGVNIAYYELGQGIPYVYTTIPFTHLTAEWQRYELLYKGIAANARLVRFDPRGFGLSDRDPADISLDGFTLDLEAVVDRLELPRFILQGVFVACSVAVNYAARHPERLTHMALLEALARVPEVVARQTESALSASDDWRFVSEALVRLFQGWDQPEASGEFAGFLRECVDLEHVRRLFDSFMRWDVSTVLPDVRTPAVIVNSVADGRSNPWAGVERGRELATALPNAQLAIVPGAPYQVYQSEAELAVRSFLGAPRPQAGPPGRPRPAPSGTAVILFTDIADSTALTERLGDAAFRISARQLDERMRSAIRAAGGSPVEGKVLGDGVMAVFTSAAQAIDAAHRCRELSAESELRLHLGVHAGDVIREADNVYGGAVNIASRICGLSAPGEILVSGTIRDLARTSAGVSFDDRGEHALKGIDDPVRLFAIRPQQ